MNDWGPFSAHIYSSTNQIFPDYSEMAVNQKVFIESFARSFGYHYKKAHVQSVNTISQSPTITTAGSGGKRLH